LRKICSYKLKNIPKEDVTIPAGAGILSAFDVNGEPTLFAVIDPAEKEVEVRTIYSFKTGTSYSNGLDCYRYIGSFSIANYGDVFHFYEDASKLKCGMNEPCECVKPLLQETPPITPEEVVAATSKGPKEYPFQIG
jgi:hypothetical protein